MDHADVAVFSALAFSALGRFSLFNSPLSSQETCAIDSESGCEGESEFAVDEGPKEDCADFHENRGSPDGYAHILQAYARRPNSGYTERQRGYLGREILRQEK